MAIEIKNIKLGLDQRNTPAPPILTNVLRAAVFLSGSAGAYVANMPLLSDHTKVMIGAFAGLFLIFIQALEILMGVNPKPEQPAAATEQTIPNQPTKD